jgi:hypothetical protein
LFDNILENIVNKVIAFHAPIEVDGPDNIGWGGIGTQQFSVKSAYNLLHKTNLVWMRIGKFFGDGGALIVFKLSSGEWLMIILLLTTVRVGGGHMIN